MLYSVPICIVRLCIIKTFTYHILKPICIFFFTNYQITRVFDISWDYRINLFGMLHFISWKKVLSAHLNTMNQDYGKGLYIFLHVLEMHSSNVIYVSLRIVLLWKIWKNKDILKIKIWKIISVEFRSGRTFSSIFTENELSTKLSLWVENENKTNFWSISIKNIRPQIKTHVANEINVYYSFINKSFAIFNLISLHITSYSILKHYNKIIEVFYNWCWTWSSYSMLVKFGILLVKLFKFLFFTLTHTAFKK